MYALFGITSDAKRWQVPRMSEGHEQPHDEARRGIKNKKNDYR